MSDRPDIEHDGKYAWYQYAIRLEGAMVRAMEVLDTYKNKETAIGMAMVILNHGRFYQGNTTKEGE